jgi:hypothetical protein
MTEATFGGSDASAYLEEVRRGLREMMAKHQMEISYTFDNEGDGASHHAVLTVGALGKEGKAGRLRSATCVARGR